MNEGTTLATLPLLRGYYRTSLESDDLRRCPDFGDNSGCVGGMGNGEGPCKPSLQARPDPTLFLTTAWAGLRVCSDAS